MRRWSAVPRRAGSRPGAGPKPPARSLVRVVLGALALVLVAMGSAGAALVTLGDVNADIGPVEARLSVELGPSGGTEVDVPPVGRLVMATHAGPLRLRADVRSVDVAAVREIVGSGSIPTAETLSADIRDGVTRLAVRAGVVTLLGAAVGCALVFRRAGAVLVGTGAAAVALGVCGGLAVATFSADALDEPQFDGLLAQAPELVGGITQARTAVDTYGTRLTELTGNVAELYGALGALPDVPGPETTPVLWVSDVHNNPAAYRVMAALIEQFDVRLVLDTGDSTDLGSSVENRLLDPVADLGVPYLWVRGNHDSAATQTYLDAMDNVTVLDGPQVVDVAGLRVAGVGDPRYTPVRQVDEADEVQQEQLAEAGRELARGLVGQQVDVVLVHESPMAAPLHGRVPLVLDGHVHRRGEQRVEGTLELTQGSSGGAGLRTFDGGEGALPLEMSILHFDPDDGSLVAADEITVANLDEQLVTFQRRGAASLAPEPEG